MNLKEYCYSITSEELFGLAIRLCEAALPIWHEYSVNNELTYRDSVVGLHHNVNPNLLLDSITFCKSETLGNALRGLELNLLLEEFSDPIVALQDSDWELPYPVECIFYAVCNLLKGLQTSTSHFGELIHYVSVNQAADALGESRLMSNDEIRKIIYPD